MNVETPTRKLSIEEIERIGICRKWFLDCFKMKYISENQKQELDDGLKYAERLLTKGGHIFFKNTDNLSKYGHSRFTVSDMVKFLYEKSIISSYTHDEIMDTLFGAKSFQHPGLLGLSFSDSQKE